MSLNFIKVHEIYPELGLTFMDFLPPVTSFLAHILLSFNFNNTPLPPLNKKVTDLGPPLPFQYHFLIA